MAIFFRTVYDITKALTSPKCFNFSTFGTAFAYNVWRAVLDRIQTCLSSSWGWAKFDVYKKNFQNIVYLPKYQRWFSSPIISEKQIKNISKDFTSGCQNKVDKNISSQLSHTHANSIINKGNHSPVQIQNKCPFQ